MTVQMNRPLIRKKLIGWYQDNHRRLPWRKTSDPYAIWVSEVMLQQTQVSTVIPYFERFISCFPNIEALAEADLEKVLKVWEGLGYYARARNLHRAAILLVSEGKSHVPKDLDEFKKLPGIGEYIAAAVQSIAFKKPCAAVDGNVKRVLSRWFQIKAPVNDVRSYKCFKENAQQFMQISDDNRHGVFNQAVMELGATICKPLKPRCASCPVSKHCLAFQNDHIHKYPRKKRKSLIPTYRVVAGVVQKNGRILITRRKPEGLLGGLWEFPGGKIREDETSEQACIREIKEEVNVNVRVELFICEIKHAYTHFKIIMDVFFCSYVSGRVRLNGPVDHRWVKFGDLEKYPFPKANRKFIPMIENIEFAF